MNKVSGLNPCPFLRALVAHGYLPANKVAVETLVDVISKADEAPAESHAKFRRNTDIVASIGNGLAPWTVRKTRKEGARLEALREGPLNKHGVGSRILDRNGVLNRAELMRIDSFASVKTGADGTRESGFDKDELSKMMDANYERSKGHRRLIDRQLMKGEWPILLRLLGKDGESGRYLSLSETRKLFEELALPARILRRLEAKDEPLGR